MNCNLGHLQRKDEKRLSVSVSEGGVCIYCSLWSNVACKIIAGIFPFISSFISSGGQREVADPVIRAPTFAHPYVFGSVSALHDDIGRLLNFDTKYDELQLRTPSEKGWEEINCVSVSERWLFHHCSSKWRHRFAVLPLNFLFSSLHFLTFHRCRLESADRSYICTSHLFPSQAGECVWQTKF
jgi:hypothetical protein